MDINYILNGSKKPSKKKPSKDPLRDLFMGQGNPIVGDRVTRKQRKVFKGPSMDLFGDWDKDGVINGLDCQPRNPKKHRANKILRERLKKVDIRMTNYPTEGELNDPNRTPPKSRDMRWTEINSQKGRVMQNTIKKYPHLLSKLEKEYPKNYLGDESIDITDKDGDSISGSYNSQTNRITTYRGYTEKAPVERAGILFHELRHKEQSKNLGNNKFHDQYSKESDDKGYRENKYEVDARKYADEQVNKSWKYKENVSNENKRAQMKMFNDPAQEVRDTIQQEDEV